MPNDSPSAKLSSFDLGALGRAIGGRYNGHVKWELYLPLRKDSGIALLCRATFSRPSGRSGDGVYERGVSGSFPSNGGRTLIGELYRLTWELERKLEEEDAAAQARPGRLPGF